eukprot:618190-Amphidinium_carterae.1
MACHAKRQRKEITTNKKLLKTLRGCLGRGAAYSWVPIMLVTQGAAPIAWKRVEESIWECHSSAQEGNLLEILRFQVLLCHCVKTWFQK